MTQKSVVYIISERRVDFDATVEEVIKDINMSLPERKLVQLIERTNLSADLKAIPTDLTRFTMKIGGKVLAIGRKILSFVFDLVKAFPGIAMGAIAALVVTALVAGVPLLGPPLSALLGPLLLALGIGAGALKDLTNENLEARINTLVDSLSRLVFE